MHERDATPSLTSAPLSLAYLQYFEKEVDVFDVSAGLNGSIQYQIDANYLPDGWHSYMAKAIKERYKKPCMTMGNIRDPKIADEILERGDADLIGIGRGLIDREGGRVSSILNMINHVAAGDYPENMKDLKVVVIGGGAVGLDVAEYFAPRGAEVSIVEMMPVIGNGIDPKRSSFRLWFCVPWHACKQPSLRTAARNVR